MDIPLTCPGCGTRVLIDAAFAGRPVRCGSCDRVFVAESAPPPRRPDPDIETVCPTCHTRLEVGAEYTYRPVRCGTCGDVFTALPLQPPARRPGVPPPYYRRPPPPPSGAQAVVSLWCGVAANLFWCFPPLGFVAGLGAVILGWTARGGAKEGHAVVGTVIGAAAMFLAVAWAVTLVVLIANAPQFAKGFR